MMDFVSRQGAGKGASVRTCLFQERSLGTKGAFLAMKTVLE
jgi:hypothetical protein